MDITSTEYRINPYPYFKQLRLEAPVFRIKPHGYWAIARYADVKFVLKNPELFSSAEVVEEPAMEEGLEFLLFSRGLIGADRPAHSRLRRLLSKAFTPQTIRSAEPKIRLICQALIKNMLSQKTVDFIQAFCAPLPIIFISELLGIDAEKTDDFKRWVKILLTWRNQNLTSEISNDIENMFYYFSDVIIERKRTPKADLISALLLACENDNLITSKELLGFIRLLLVAGTETTTNLLGNAMLALLSHSEYLKQISQDHTKIPNFIEETLRYDGPVLSLSRRLTADTIIAGVKIPKGEIVLPLVASANHDETIFSEPEKFDIKRNTQRQLGFGSGIHYCLGSQLARLQARVAFEELFKVFENFELISKEPLNYLNSFFFRGLQKLPLLNERHIDY